MFEQEQQDAVRVGEEFLKQAKLKKKNVDMIVANNLRQEGGVFGKDDNRVTIYKKSGEVIDLPKLTKDEVAEEILNQIKLLRAQI